MPWSVMSFPILNLYAIPDNLAGVAQSLETRDSCTDQYKIRRCLSKEIRISVGLTS